ncbi:MAG: hypothetical protein KDA22_16225, partial [Phycisphaerales bacterium]|nr:hypothetical protein [Phycisphaerales bacterium]
LGGLVLAGASFVAYVVISSRSSSASAGAVRAAATGTIGFGWAATMVVAGATQLGTWIAIRRRGTLAPGLLRAATGTSLATILAATCLREAIRVQSMDMDQLAPLHAHSARMGGLVVFLVFAAINAVLVGWCIRIASRPARPASSLPA